MKLTKEQVEGIKLDLEKGNNRGSSGWLSVLYNDLAGVCETALALHDELERAMNTNEKFYRTIARREDKILALQAEIAALNHDLNNYKMITPYWKERAEKAEAEADRWKSGFVKMAESEDMETTERVQWQEKAEKAEGELAELRDAADPTQATIYLHWQVAELRDAVNWYFECKETKYLCCQNVEAVFELGNNYKHAEQSLRLRHWGGSDG